MRILMVSDDYLPNPGGIAAHVHELSCALAELGHTVDLVTGHNSKHAGALPPLPDAVRLLQHRSFPWNALGYTRTAFATARRLRRAVAEEHYDVCHWHSLIWETYAVAWGAASLPRVFTNHSSGYLRRARSKLRLHTQLRAIMRVPHRVIAPSHELLERSVDAGLPRDRASYIPNGVDVRAFQPGPADAELARRYGLRAGDRVVIAPRRLERKNGVDVLLRAIPQLRAAMPQVKVLLMGDGDERGSLEQLARQLGIDGALVFCGNQPRSSVLAHLRLAHVCALPSRAEAVSLAGLEAMAAGLPVVGSDVGGIPEFVRDGENGALVPVEDPGALAGALAHVLRDEEDRRARGAMARRSVALQFSWLAAARRTVEVYEAAARTR